MRDINKVDEKPYTKARFFKCALQVNPAGYIKYRGQQQTICEDDYNQQLLEAALEAGIDVVGIADHGSVDAVDKLRRLFAEHGVIVFPGFEIASSEKIHFVCLFDESKTSQELERVLGSLRLLDPQDGIRPSRLSAEQLIDEVAQQGGFIFAPHCTNDNGLLKIGQMNHVWQHKDLRAAQIPGPIEDLKSIESDFYRKVILNKDPNYRRDHPMAAINAADVSKPEEIKADGASCLIKMTKPCFVSFKQAFKDPESRVRLNSDRPENYSSALERVSFVGGYLDGVDIEFSDHLNALIGGRGTGKSTLIECIRYVLNFQPFGAAAKKQHDDVVKANLGVERGRVELKVRSAAMHGRRFKVSRKYGDDPMVLDEGGNVTPYRPRDLLPGLELFGQNEIYEMTRDPQSRHQLVERFLEGDHAAYDEVIANVLHRLKENSDSVVKALKQKNEIEEDVERLPKLQDQAQQFRELGLDEKLKVIPILEKEKQLSSRSSEEVSRLQDAIDTLQDSLPDTAFLSDAALESLPHADLLRNHRSALDGLTLKAQEALKQLTEAQKQTNAQLMQAQEQLQASVAAEELTLERAFKDIPASQGKTGQQIGVEYQALLRQIEHIKPKKAVLQSRQAYIEELYRQRKKLLYELSETSSARASAMQRSVKRLNKRLEKKVQLTLQNEGDRQPLLTFLVDCRLEGVGPKRLSWVADGEFSPAALAERIRLGEDALRETGWGISPFVISALCHLPERTLLEMEALALPDTMEIELNVTHGMQEPRFRKINELSTGQQCTAVLHLLLLDNHDPLILDQPEDNLDNAFIAERIVTELRNAKLSRQFMFATHNANIPVFGDAEWIGVLTVEDSKGRILPEHQGAIDLPNIQHLTADILEGGEVAFNQRREKYGFD